MGLRLSRLGVGEALLAGSATLLLVDLFGVAWFEGRSAAASAGTSQLVAEVGGWDALTVLGPLTLVVGAVGMLASVLAALRSSPALPVVITTLLLPVSGLQTLLLAIRVFVDRPTAQFASAGATVQTRPGAFIAVGLSFLICVGAYLSLRREDHASGGVPAVIETVDVQESSPRGSA